MSIPSLQECSILEKQTPLAAYYHSSRFSQHLLLFIFLPHIFLSACISRTAPLGARDRAFSHLNRILHARAPKGWSPTHLRQKNVRQKDEEPRAGKSLIAPSIRCFGVNSWDEATDMSLAKGKEH